jgi:hypothetical protein
MLLYVPPGVWLTGPFNLTSHMTLFLARDATIKATQVSYFPLLLLWVNVKNPPPFLLCRWFSFFALFLFKSASGVLFIVIKKIYIVLSLVVLCAAKIQFSFCLDISFVYFILDFRGIFTLSDL